ncbi:MAG TPA: hypothetical protein DIT10_20845 [Chryseobacterium sp.]|uniref:hypothetical protein n=1 Tax=Chryseobacterium lactis TaxID=1241981 RepID=UPI000EB87EB9|nr:hypothetical protein [Chryseobacterium lactis]HCN51501.1 hypothetical protein [Chryseobacterium sp.]
MSSQNPEINQNGSASINSGQYCIWKTANGSSSTLNITNASRANNLIIAITGAPSTGLIVQVNGTLQPSVDNIWTLPPNSPSMAVIATGNFGGSTVTITNITNAQNDAEAAIQCQTTATA